MSSHYFQIADPYRWLEDPNSTETKSYIDAQNKMSQDFLDSFGQIGIITTKLFELRSQISMAALPLHHGNYYFYKVDVGLKTYVSNARLNALLTKSNFLLIFILFHTFTQLYIQKSIIKRQHD